MDPETNPEGISKPTKLQRLRLKRISLVDDPANQLAVVTLYKSRDLSKAERSAASTNDLPDSCFAYIEPGGKKDSEGKTTPRSLRHLPYKNADGSIDLAHLRNALARLNQTDISAEGKASARRKLEAAARREGVGDHEKTEKAEKEASADPEAVKRKGGEDGEEDTGSAEKANDGDADDMDKGMSCGKCAKKMSKGAVYCSNCGEKMPKASKSRIATPSDEDDDDGDDIVKGEVDPRVRRMIEKANRRAEDAEAKANLASSEIEKMKEESKVEEAIIKCRKLNNISVDPEKFGALLRRVEKGTSSAKDSEEILRVLTAANNSVTRKRFEQVGSDAKSSGGSNGIENTNSPEPGSAEAEIKAKCQELISKSAADKKLSYMDAMDVVMKENRELWDRYRREQRRSAAKFANGEDE